MITKKFVLLDIDYITRNHEPVIRLFGKLVGDNEEGHIIVMDKSFRPYIYVIPSDHSRLDDCTRQLSELKLLSVEKVIKNDMGELKEVLKVTFKHPQDIPKLRDKILNLKSVKEIREHNIPFYRRYLIDKGLFPLKVVEVQGNILNSPRSSRGVRGSRRSQEPQTGSPEGSSIQKPCIFQVEKSPTPLESSLPEFTVLSFDIEVYNPRGMPQPDLDPIIMISFSSNHGFRKVLSTKNTPDSSDPNGLLLDFVEVVSHEKELLEKFVETVQSENPDIILGYNSDSFDFPYIRDRAAKLGVPLKLGIDGSSPKFTRIGFSSSAMIRGRVHIDLYSNIRRYMHLARHTLEHVYLELFGEEKLDIPGDKIYLYWDEGGRRLETLFHYSLHDAVAVTRIGERMLPLNTELTRIVGQPLFDAARMASGRLVEWYLIRKSFEQGYLVPNKPSPDELIQREGKHVVGGYVKEPVSGLHENIVYFDFRSLYPSIIISKNISPDSLTSGENCHISPEYGHKFLKEPVGFIPSAIGQILQDRIKIKSQMKESRDDHQLSVLNNQQEALKRLANTFYGLYNHSTFRWYSLKCSESITAWGRDFLKKTMKNSEKQGFKPVYADTDGFFATYVGPMD
ncbi:DNA-directed DNA polymerase [Methanobacterium formicicum]|uniref:DNA polymerase n=1 Tax=Methanobacterium formicicum (strain DSM 3637 / PP1) TaxID=1204725 RepID=K2RAE9_METFP|nr:DNA-directed DNA polymerase [Methanobacterium formicicum]EKF85279.1 DNA polymerase B region [Methanobacterium formicicum DSM 3637]